MGGLGTTLSFVLINEPCDFGIADFFSEALVPHLLWADWTTQLLIFCVQIDTGKNLKTRAKVVVLSQWGQRDISDLTEEILQKADYPSSAHIFLGYQNLEEFWCVHLFN